MKTLITVCLLSGAIFFTVIQQASYEVADPEPIQQFGAGVEQIALSAINAMDVSDHAGAIILINKLCQPYAAILGKSKGQADNT